MMPAAMGTGHRINKRTSHITLVLAEKIEKAEKTPKAKPVRQAEDKEVKAKAKSKKVK
jgi:hypothetical protein